MRLWLFSVALLLLTRLQGQDIIPHTLHGTLYGYDGRAVNTAIRAYKVGSELRVTSLIAGQKTTWLFNNLSYARGVYISQSDFYTFEIGVSRKRITSMYYSNNYYTMVYGLIVEGIKTRKWE